MMQRMRSEAGKCGALGCGWKRSGWVLGLAAWLFFPLGNEAGTVVFEDRFEGRLGPGWSWLRENPQYHLGKTFVLGGAIIETENYSDRTLLVVLHHGLGFANKPDPGSGSEGRFLVQVREFLDPAIFRPGRLVTVLGEVVGEDARPLQDGMYVYPVIAGSEMHLWPDADQLPGQSRFRFGLGVGIGF